MTEVFWFDAELRWWCALRLHPVGSRIVGPFDRFAECVEAYYRRATPYRMRR